MLDYSEALTALEKAISLSGERSKPDLKRAALLKQSAGEWEALGLSASELQELGNFLQVRGAADSSIGNSLELTTEWLSKVKGSDADRIARALADRGGYTDFQVLHNVVWG